MRFDRSEHTLLLLEFGLISRQRRRRERVDIYVLQGAGRWLLLHRLLERGCVANQLCFFRSKPLPCHDRAATVVVVVVGVVVGVVGSERRSHWENCCGMGRGKGGRLWFPLYLNL